MRWLETCALYPLTKTTLLSFAVKTLHSVFDLIDRLFLSIKPLHADQIVRISHKIRLDRHIEGRISCHRWTQIYLDEPWFQIRVNQNVKPEQLEAVCSVCAVLLHCCLYVVLSAKKGLDDDIINS